MGDIFYTKISNIFFFFAGGGGGGGWWGGLKILIFFGVNGRCWAQDYVWRKN